MALAPTKKRSLQLMSLKSLICEGEGSHKGADKGGFIGALTKNSWRRIRAVHEKTITAQQG